MNHTELLYLKMFVAELLSWFRGWRPRTRERVIQEYTDWQVDLSLPVLAIHPDGQLQRLTVGDVRQRNWRRILGGLAELGVTQGSVLEIGGGDGTNMRALRQLAPEISWQACDLVPRDIEVCACDATSLPYPDSSFDAVITYNAFEQMPGDIIYRATREIARVSKKGLVSIEPDYQRANFAQKFSMIRKDYVKNITSPATSAGFKLLSREWTICGNPLNRASFFIFHKNF